MAIATSRVDRKLQLKEVLDWLVQDGVVDAEAVSKLLHDARVGHSNPRHPLTVIAEARIRAKAPPNALLTPDLLVEWLAGRLKMPVYHIDPLKIDLRAVTQVMSADYAQRRGILPVEVDGKDVTIATSEPFAHHAQPVLQRLRQEGAQTGAQAT